MTSVTPIARIASATVCPCATRTSTWRSFATISSGLCLFLDIGPSSFGSYEPYLRADHCKGGGSIDDHCCPAAALPGIWLRARSEERRVGKECRSRWSPYH